VIPRAVDAIERAVDVDHSLPASQIGTLLQQIVVAKPSRSLATMRDRDDHRVSDELRELTMHQDEREHPGERSPYSCPECGGVLWELKDGELMRFRCRVGHAYTHRDADSRAGTDCRTRVVECAAGTGRTGGVRRRMAERADRMEKRITAERHAARACELDAQAQQVRNLVLAGLGSVEEEATAEEPASEEPAPKKH